MPEKFPSHILCPVDLSELSAAALRYTAMLRSHCGARVTVLYAHSFEVPPYFTPAQASAIRAQYMEAASAARAAVESFAGHAGLTGAHIRIEEGDPATALLNAAWEIGADLIIMGTHGRSGIERIMLGSVAERVLRHSPVPVVTVRGSVPPTGLNKIVCPVNNSAASRKAFSTAARLAACFGAQLTVIHVEEAEPSRHIGDLCAWIDEGQRPNCEIRELRRHGNPAEEILKLTRTLGADLLVIGAEHKAFFDSAVLGSTTVRAVRHATCPVLTVVEEIGGQDVISSSFDKTVA